ncbi:hypothetical protein LY474_17995 [Myxococcus stipitatus]|uniref:hypothetical protein n=1 Tax=Myxococcus stipitatus TaxID=83455 RepID=UPI001F2B5BB7|nr:hypothetical protein [Myxococcus stipitatus]MCE9669691.1 hypothetical protein [Myxococcus stipitatus]
MPEARDVEVRAVEGKPSSPVVVLAMPESPFALRVNGQSERMNLLPNGRHTVSGAAELWFTLPRWKDDGEVELEIRVELLPR